MISYQFKFNKILAIKDNEKDQMLIQYNEAVNKFEKIAEQLYQYLKQKEDLENNQKELLTKGLSIHLIQQQEQWIHNLENIIVHYQTKVIHARGHMQEKQSLLQEKNVEVKKYQKLKENHKQIFIQKMNEDERKLLDEVSIQQYMNRGN